MSITQNDQFFMSHALRLAKKGLWSTDPNPRVGCVLVKDGEIIGEGWHQQAGQAHAEVIALKQAGKNAQGSTCYVTLEPCSHHGKTPPCAAALVKAKVSRVVMATYDPNPQVRGEGAARLRTAGIQVDVGVLSTEAESLNPGFFKRMNHNRPFVRCKMAMSLDGRTAMKSGESQWITGAEARQDVQSLRARSSAIMTGVGTILFDDPSMTVRPDELLGNAFIPNPVRQPLRIIIDKHLSLPLDAKILSLEGDCLVFTASDNKKLQAQLNQKGIEVVYLPNSTGGIDLSAMCRYLAEQEINEIHLECGATLAGSMLKAGLIDELVVYMAPMLMGNQARGLFNLPELDKMSNSYSLEIQDIRAIGKDWRITAKFEQNQTNKHG